MNLKSFSPFCVSTTPAVFAAVVTILASAFLVGCETTGDARPAGSMTTIESIRSGVAIAPVAKGVTIAKGMTKSEVIGLMGEPAAVEHIAEGDTLAEVWTYIRKKVVDSTIEPMGMQERLVADPLTGVFSTVSEPIYRNESVYEETSTKLLFNDDQLVALKEEVIGGLSKVENHQ